ncbi:MAG: tRNA (adenosine(37)-N6)-threonylcarbamoyltransferase complex dimerization subunit type 1 TsaB [Chlorobi bacterium]|nr:tRNA (adenosine(37)-N6)-threonylcarbamoyltransferase complex dimerization subunit type 1 TsaB [Chlorobiota bacterium]
MEIFKPILAIETSEMLCSCALILNENDFSEFNIRQKNIHSEKLMEMISALFNNSEVKLKDVGHIAVSIGPGSFTGLRIGLSVAKGLAYGADLPLIPVPNFNALALQISSYLELNEKFIVANKANITELYVSQYQVTEHYFKQIEEVKLVNTKEFLDKIQKTDNVFGNFSNQDKKKYSSSPNAVYVGKWSYIFGKDLVTYDYDFLEPNYLKKFVVKVKK